MSEPDGNHGQGRWNDNSLSTRCKQKHIQLYWAQGKSCMKMEFFEGVKPPEKQKTYNFSQGRTCKSTLPSSQQPPKLTSEYEDHNFLCRKKRKLPPMHRVSQMFGGSTDRRGISLTPKRLQSFWRCFHSLRWIFFGSFFAGTRPSFDLWRTDPNMSDGNKLRTTWSNGWGKDEIVCLRTP